MAHELAQLLDLELSEGVPPFELGRLKVPSLSWRDSTSWLAELLADTDDRSSREYKNARRNVERWEPSPAQRRKGAKRRRPSRASTERLETARRQQTDRLRRFRARGADMRIYVGYFSDGPRGWLPPHGYVQISKTTMRFVIRLWAGRELDEAADELFRAFLRGYDVPNATDWLGDADVEDLYLEPQE